MARPGSRKSASASTSRARRSCSRDAAGRDPRRRPGHAPATASPRRFPRRSSRSPAGRSPSISSTLLRAQRHRATSCSASGISASRFGDARRRRALRAATSAMSFDGPRLLGTGGALRRALPLLGEAFFVLYGDSYLDCDYAAVEAAFHAAGRPALMTVFRNEDRWDASNVAVRDGRIVRYDKRRRAHAGRCDHIDYGLGAIRRRAHSIPTSRRRRSISRRVSGPPGAGRAGRVRGADALLRDRVAGRASPKRGSILRRPDHDDELRHEQHLDEAARHRRGGWTRRDRADGRAARRDARAPAGACSSSASAAAPPTARTP